MGLPEAGRQEEHAHAQDQPKKTVAGSENREDVERVRSAVPSIECAMREATDEATTTRAYVLSRSVSARAALFCAGRVLDRGPPVCLFVLCLCC